MSHRMQSRAALRGALRTLVMKRGTAWCLLALAAGLVTGPARGETSHYDRQAELASALADFDHAQQVQASHPERARQLFRSAAQTLEGIVASGVNNGRLEYNLGNCYLQAGSVGKAILHYRRALRLIPRDPLLAANLAEARSRCLTRIRPTRGSTVLRNVFFWHYDTSIRERCTLATSLYVLFWILLAVRGFAPRRSIGIAVIVFGLSAATLAGSLGAQRWVERRMRDGVITSMDVTVYKGPGTGYQRQFEQPLQPGVEFSVLEDRPGWVNVRLPDGKSGWIDSSTAELVIRSRESLDAM